MFNLTLQKWLLILAGVITLLIIATSILGYSLYLEKEKSESLETSLEIFEKDIQNLQQENFRIIDSLKFEQGKGKERILYREQKIEALLIYVDSLLKTNPNEENIDALRDLDSIAFLFAKYYPDKSRTGQGSN